MLGFKRLDQTTTTITGIELIHQIQKGQFDVTAPGSPAMRMQQGGRAGCLSVTLP